MKERMIVKKKLIVMMGPPASGKSTITKLIAENHNKVCVISRDTIRFALLQEGEDYFAHEDEVVETFYSRINEALRNSDYDIVIADQTNVTLRARSEFWAKVSIPSNVEVLGIWVEIPKEVAISRNKNRTGRACVPDSVIKNMYAHSRKPDSKIDWFDRVITIDNTCNAEKVRKYLNSI